MKPKICGHVFTRGLHSGSGFPPAPLRSQLGVKTGSTKPKQQMYCAPSSTSLETDQLTKGKDLPTYYPPEWLLKCCFTSTETVGLLGTGAQDVPLDFHTPLSSVTPQNPTPKPHLIASNRFLLVRNESVSTTHPSSLMSPAA